jgi:hypothetical protein
MPFVKHTAHMLLLSRLSGELQAVKNADRSASQGPLPTTGMRAEVTWVCASARDASPEFAVSAPATCRCLAQAAQLGRTNTARRGRSHRPTTVVRSSLNQASQAELRSREQLLRSLLTSVTIVCRRHPS